MRDSAATCDGAGGTREVTTLPYRNASAVGDDSGWAHATRQLLMSGQTFCGQSGHGFAGLSHGSCSAAADAAGIGPAMARAIDVVIGTTASAPSMATMPSAANQRWNGRLLTDLNCHTLCRPARIRPLSFLINELP